MIKLSQKVGLIDPMELDLVRRSLVLNETIAREIMTPRVSICGIADTASLGEIRNTFDKEQYSRLPVFHGALDQVVGILHMKEIHLHRHDTQFDLKKHLRPPLFFPESVVLGTVLDGMRQSKSHLAILVDEFGGTSGLVSLEDIMEQVFGDISDEYDIGSPPRIQWVGASSFDAEGRTPLTEVQAFLAERKLPRLTERDIEGVTTLGGLIQKEGGAIPSVGASIVVGSYRFRIRKVKDREIVSLSGTITPENGSGRAGGDPLSRTVV
jgi:CBS domain containing-hemolysin-like protein